MNIREQRAGLINCTIVKKIITKHNNNNKYYLTAVIITIVKIDIVHSLVDQAKSVVKNLNKYNLKN